jgi:methylmalonyl-CoA decarboxylase subunit alpha
VTSPRAPTGQTPVGAFGPNPPAGRNTGGVVHGTSDDQHDELNRRVRRALAGNQAKAGDKLARQGKMFVRDRLDLLLDPSSFVEDGLLANNQADDLPADGVVTGVGRVDDRPVCVMANDPTVKAGSWGARTVEKIVRLTEYALRHELPVFWLVDSAGARITDQVELFPGRRGAGRIFYNQVRLSGKVPQICCLFGPSAAGGAYIPSFCDVVFMVEANASMYLGSPRMAEMVIGEQTTLEDMGGARMHATVSGCGDNLAIDDPDAIDQAKAWLSYFPQSWRQDPPHYETRPAAKELTAGSVPNEEHLAYDMHDVIDALVDEESFFERMPLFAPEVITGLARLEGRPVGIVANNPQHKGGVLFVDSADKAARFVWLCDAFNVPLLFLADVPGFMIGTEVEQQGIIRHGAKMVTAVSEATVPKVSVIVRKAYGAGLYAMSGPAFEPEATLALPTARIAVMGPEAAVNAVYANKIAAIEDEAAREAFVAERRSDYEADVDLYRLASELVVDTVVDFGDLRRECVARLELADAKDRTFSERRHGVPPV